MVDSQGKRAAAIPLLMTPDELAAALRLSPRKIRAMKSAGQLPPAINIGRAVRWRRADVIDWISVQIQHRTSGVR